MYLRLEYLILAKSNSDNEIVILPAALEIDHKINRSMLWFGSGVRE